MPAGPQLKGGGHGGLRYMQEAERYASRIAGCKTEGLCANCTDIVEYKKKSGKYRPMKQPAKCAACGQKTVHQAYATFCQPCAQSKCVCMRCGGKRAAPKPRSAQDNLVQELQAQLDAGGHNERQRRTLLRKIEKAKGLRREIAKQVREANAAGLTAADYPSDDEEDGKAEGDEVEGELAQAAPAAEAPRPTELLPQLQFDANAKQEFSFGSGNAKQDFSFGSSNPFVAPPALAAAPPGVAVAVASDMAAMSLSAAAPPQSSAAAGAVESATAATKPLVFAELCTAAAVDNAFDGAWAHILSAVDCTTHVARADAAFDAVCSAVSEAAADRMSDSIAASGTSEAELCLETMREVLRWRAAQIASSAEGAPVDVSEEAGASASRAGDAAAAAAEDVARLLHQLFSISRAWPTLAPKWVDGRKVM
jgi:hypothetical protein